MASETGIDIVYRTAITSFGSPYNKTLHAVVFDGFAFVPTISTATENNIAVVIYAFNNSTGWRKVDEADVVVTYDDAVYKPHATLYPNIHGKSFVVEFSSGLDESAPVRGFIDFFGNIFGLVKVSTRAVGIE